MFEITYININIGIYQRNVYDNKSIKPNIDLFNEKKKIVFLFIIFAKNFFFFEY